MNPHDRRIGIHHPRTRQGFECHVRREVDACNLVPVDPFRERFLDLRDRKILTTSQLCWHMGWTYRPSDQAARRETRHGLKPNTTYARRTLGLYARRGCNAQQFVTYEVAERLCRALGMDPFEVGI